LALAATTSAFAGRPFTTEDAAILGSRECHVETWLDRSRVATDYWLVPACNLGAHIEWQFGGARRRESRRSALSESYAQAKTVFRHDDNAAWNAGLVVGVVRRPADSLDDGWRNPYVLVPFTIGTPGSASLHANVGWRRDSSRRNVTLWGIASESAVHGGFAWLGEVFGENRERPFLRIGGRYALVKDHVDIDLSMVTRRRAAREERWVSLGVTVQSGRFLH
jgi:hypothetical protein